MPVGDTLREMFVKVGFQVDPASEEKLNTSLTGSVLKANLLSDALSRFASELMGSINRTAEAFSNLKEISDRTGANVSNIRAMQYALRQFGLSGQEAIASLESFQRQMRENPNFKKYWEDLVPDVKNFTDAQDQLDAIFKWLAEQPRWVAEQYNKKFHLAPDNMFDVIMRHYKEVKVAAQEHKDIMSAFGTSGGNAAENSRKMVQNMERLRDVGSAFYLNAINFLLPGFNEGLKESFELIIKNKDKINEWQTDFGKAMGVVGVGVKDLAIGIDMIAQTLGGWQNTLGFIGALLAGTFLAALGPTGWFVIGVTAILIASAEIKKHWEDIVKDIQKVKELENAPGSESSSGETALPKEQMERAGQGFTFGREETDAEKRTRDATEKTAKNTEEIAEATRDQKKGGWWNPFKALKDLFSGPVGIGAGQGEGGGTGAGGAGGKGGGASPSTGGGRGGGGAGGGTGPGGAGGGGSPATGTLAKNQGEAYRAARELGYSDAAARAMVANFSGESLSNPANTSGDNGQAQGIAQWHPDRAEAIKKHFGKYPYQMSIKEQVAAFKWETENNPAYAETRRALEGGGTAESMVDTLVRNFERPKYPDTDVQKRLGMLRGLPKSFDEKATGASAGFQPTGFVFHHTGGRGTPEGVRNTLNQRGLGVQYIMDRDGNIVPGTGTGKQAHIRPSPTGLSNANAMGMEIIARDDSDITPAQIESAKKFMRENYPNLPAYGHGEINAHKQRTEGMSVVAAIRAERERQQARSRVPTPNESVVFRRPLNDMHRIGKQSSLSSSVTMHNSNTFNMGNGGPHEAVQVASLVGRENERAAAKMRNTASSKLREFVPRVT